MKKEPSASIKMKSERPVLAIETSGELCTVAVYFSASKFAETSLKIGRSHSKLILKVIKNLMDLTDTGINNLRHIAVSIGPGSFTGLRIGLAAAKGIAFGAECTIIPVPTFEAMASQISAALEEGAIFTLVNKVNTKELYSAKFQKNKNSIKFVEEVSVVNRSEFRVANGERVFGNVELPGVEIEQITFSPSAVTIAGLSLDPARLAEITDQDILEPFYLKDFPINIG